MLTKAEILAELKKRKRNYRQCIKKIRRHNMKWSEFIRKYKTGSFVACELELKLEHLQRIFFIADTVTRKIYHCSPVQDGDGIA